MKENKKIDELSQKLEAIVQQEAQNYPMTGTRRWFFQIGRASCRERV